MTVYRLLLPSAFLLLYPAILLICPIPLPAIIPELLSKRHFFIFLYFQIRLCRAAHQAPKQNLRSQPV